MERGQLSHSTLDPTCKIPSLPIAARTQQPRTAQLAYLPIPSFIPTTLLNSSLFRLTDFLQKTRYAGFGKDRFFLLNATVQIILPLLDLDHHCMHGSRGCLGCCARPPLIISVDQPTQGLKIQGHRVKKHNIITKDFWSSSAGEMDNSAFPSQRSISSISTLNQTTDPNSSSASSSQPSEFVNPGLLLWNQTRQQWSKDKDSNQAKKGTQERKLSWNATYDSLLGSTKPFPRPVPLPEMVEFLVDVWEQEGLYD